MFKYLLILTFSSYVLAIESYQRFKVSDIKIGDNLKSYTTNNDRLMDILADSLYSNRQLFIRELISNSEDAISKKKLINSDFQNGSIDIIIDKVAGTISVLDNGVGMCSDELETNLGTVGKSGAYEIKTQNKNEKELIGQFGVGFYSVFLVSDSVEVISKCAKEQTENYWKTASRSHYQTGPMTKEHYILSDRDSGTIVTVRLQKKYVKEFTDLENVLNVIKKHHKYHKNIIRIGKNSGTDSDIRELPVIKPLWEQEEISKEESTALYKEEFLAQEDPLWFKSFATKNYKAVIFISSKPRKDVLQAINDNESANIKLYVRRVLITDKIQNLLPPYFSFIRGIIDSDKMPVKVDREAFSDSSKLNSLKKSLKQLVLSEMSNLSNKADNELKVFMETKQIDKDGNLPLYIKFYKNYGTFLTSGCINENEPKSQQAIGNLLRFFSLIHQPFKISLDFYINKMPKGQKKIYYLHLDSLDQMLSHPAAEIFENSKVDLLLLNGSFDEGCLTQMKHYKDYEFMNIAKSEITDNDIAFIKTGDHDKALKWLEKHTIEYKQINKDYEQFLKIATELFGNQIDSVKMSERLVKAPVMISTPKIGLSPAMDRMMSSNVGINHELNSFLRNMKIVEFNPDNLIIKNLNLMLKNETNLDFVKQTLQKLFEVSLLSCGYQITKPELLLESIYAGIQKEVVKHKKLALIANKGDKEEL